MPLDQEANLHDAEYAFLSKLVEEKTGIVLRGERHRNMVQGRLMRRLRALNIPDYTAYCNLLKNDNSDDEITHVINAVTTNVTAFFREEHHFEHLKDYLQFLSKNKQTDKRIRLWSAACSTGEEPYSIAMTACEAIPDIKHWDLKILATDIDTSVLEKARQGTYPNTIEEVLPTDYLSKYTKAVNAETLSITNEVKSLIQFNSLNLLHSWPVKGPFDAIFCRNVFIYFNPETQLAIARRFADLLQPGGFLYIGHSENLLHLSDRLQHAGKTIYKKVE